MMTTDRTTVRTPSSCPPRTARRHRSPALAVTAALLLVLTACTGATGEEPSPTPEPPSPAPTPTAEPSPEPTATPGPVDTVAYYLVDTRAGLRLARELGEGTGTDAVVASVQAMVDGADDPDYSTAWDPATEVLSVGPGADGTIVVDLSAQARQANIGSQGAALMIQQLVHTVTAAAEDETAGVLLTIDGEPAGELWGTVVWDEPVTRADPLEVRVLVQIDEPREGTVTSSPITVSGEANVFEATVLWSVLDADGTEVAADFTTTAEGQTFAPFTFSVDLEPGTYTVVISESDPSDGEAGTPMSDSRSVTVE
ncbi:Gmad2 immunoglobulin-like domain-containing protein [Actinotalea sp. K2]|uniref:Gmad2 immunoglobulin-like domain-containing protein n=1 Tax=Actinotalea sp. K2 TaxID=2939438 RepID=UPI002016C3D5|nr:Gmad2 immunoglobulin-like domain-containing protein [Actinotalea sp. K2]MCL3859571.1 GerMN domain-containing protein [Actinotalea sp. K2]